MRTTVTITVRGDPAYVKRLKKLAALLERDMADVTRDALDKVYGDGIADPPGVSFASVVPSKEQMTVRGT